MQKILRKRIGRDFKENLFRYLALGLLIILCMYMVVSLIGAADTIISGTGEEAQKNKMEDGEFTTFVPLDKQEEESLTDKGITLEKMFYLDYELDDDSVIRVFQNRNNINMIALDEGRLAEKEDEAVLEKRYAGEHDLVVGDKIKINGMEFSITGIGSVPDYEAPFKEMSDSTVDSMQFGLAFVTADAYDICKDAGGSKQSEEYVYAYRLNGKMTDEKLKNEIKKLEFKPEEVSDTYFQDYWEETAGKRDEISDGISELADGAKELQDGLEELDGHGDDLDDGAAEVFSAYLEEANKGFKDYGLKKELTEENFEDALADLKNSSDNAIFRLKITSIEEQLKALKDYKDGTAEYTDGVEEAADGATELTDGVKELKDETDELLDEYFSVDVENLTQFVTAADNPRIGAAADDQVINKIGGLVAGVIIMILFTYVISVFVVHGIEKESTVIGALYALGVKKTDLLLHYLTLPVVVTVVASVIGTLLGFSSFGIDVQMQDCYEYFSMPALSTAYSPYLLGYGLVMPFAAAVLVNWLVIRRKLSKPVLSLMKKEQKSGRIGRINLGNMSFIGKFRVRQMLRELRTGFTVIFGMFVSLLILMLGVDCYVLCKNISVENKADTKYEYMYTYKYPEEEAPEGGTACFAKSLKKERFGYNLDVTVLGIEKDNPYFDAEVEKGKNKVILSSAAAQKYGLSTGDKLILTDEEENMDYAFTVVGETQFSTGLYAFMDIESMRELFGESDDYYNVVFSDKELDIPAGRLYSVTSRGEIEKASDIFVSKMMPMVYMMVGVSALIFCVVMYLMMKVMIDRSAFGISLVKIFGYRMKEIKKLYLNGNFYIVAIGAAICVPLSKTAMDAMYPVLVSNVACGMNLHFSLPLYGGIYLAVLALYFVINAMLVRQLKKVTPAEILKNRE